MNGFIYGVSSATGASCLIAAMFLTRPYAVNHDYVPIAACGLVTIGIVHLIVAGYSLAKGPRKD